MDRNLQKVLESPEAAKFLWENGREGIALLSDSGIIKYVNTALCNILGYSDVELSGVHFSEITMSTDIAADSIKFSQLVGNEIPEYSMAKRWRTKLGKVVPGELKVRRWFDGILIYGAVMPVDPIVRAAMGDSEAQSMLDESIGRVLRSIPKNIVKNWRIWAIIFSVIFGGAGVKELLALMS